jgi:hypothetical protein
MVIFPPDPLAGAMDSPFAGLDSVTLKPVGSGVGDSVGRARPGVSMEGVTAAWVSAGIGVFVGNSASPLIMDLKICIPTNEKIIKKDMTIINPDDGRLVSIMDGANSVSGKFFSMP